VSHDDRRLLEMDEEDATHYILVKPWATYVKTAEFFRQQRADTPEGDRWHAAWKPVKAESIEAARKIGEQMP